jgi:hypothetical protein
MFFTGKKYTTLHPQSVINYELLKFNQICTSQNYPNRMGCGSGLDLPW